MKNLIQSIQEKLVFNKHTKAKSDNILDDLQKYGINIMSEDDIDKFSYFHTVKYNIDQNYLSKLRTWYNYIFNKFAENKHKLDNTVNYLKTIDNTIQNIVLQRGIANVKIIKIRFESSKYDLIQIKLVPAYLKRFIIEIYDKDKIEERKNIALYTIKYILENS